MKCRRADRSDNPRCPACSGLRIFAQKRTGRWICDNCGCSFEFAEAVEAGQRAAPKERTRSGSGVVAGKITIGRGFNWKAGRL